MRTVSRLSVAPVKSLALHHPDEILLERHGVSNNRRFYLVQPDGRLFVGLHHGQLVRVRPEYDAGRDRLALHFPEGEVVEGEIRLGEAIETDFWGRPVAGHFVEGQWAGALSAFAGRPLRLVKADRPGDASDGYPVSLLSEASVEELARRSGRDAVDGRRFRMLVAIAGCEPHEEDGWAGRRVRIGEAVVLVVRPVPRCATTTRDPSSGRRDFDALRAIKAYRGLREGKKIDFGVYAEVEEPGRVRVGDPVEPY